MDLADLKRKMKFSGKVLKTTLAGAVVDIGLEVPGVVHISQLRQEPTNRVEDVVQVGQVVDVWVKHVDPKKKRIDLTMIKPLDLEWREITKGMIVKGKVVRLEKFGVFVDIGAERPGLVHISEMTHGYIKSPDELVKEGDEVEAQVLEVNRRKKQIKLSMKALEEKPEAVVKPLPVAREKAKGKEKGRKEKEETLPVEVEPTAMEIALREAMERSRMKERTQKSKARRKSGAAKDELESILSRTLEHKVRTGK
jgi:ribosomal protein S1